MAAARRRKDVTMMIKHMIAAGALVLCSAAAFALPSSEEVQSAVKAGNYAQAETMMHEVVDAKPQSAKAHYVYAEILAHDAKFDEAARQADWARRIDPSIGFTDPAKFRSFEQLLQREQNRTRAALSPRVIDQAPAQTMPLQQQQHIGNGLPGWVWGLGFAALAFLIWRMVSRRQTMGGQPAAAYGGGYGPQGGGFGAQGGGFGGTPMGSAPGGGMLRTGLAAAGGLAGGMLLEKYLEGDRHNGDDLRDAERPGGQQGVLDNGAGQAASDLEARPVDFGSGNGWGGDASSAADDFTPSGDDGGW
jgi:hypothetical protein